MKISGIRRSPRPGILLLLVPLVPYLCLSPANAGDTRGKPLLANLDWTVQQDEVVIIYDLLGDRDESFDVSVTMLQRNDSTFRIVPSTMTGDIGPATTAGPGRIIRWRWRDDIPWELTGGGYYFELRTERSAETKWWLMALGAAAAGGLTAVLMASARVKEGPSPAAVPRIGQQQRP